MTDELWSADHWLDPLSASDELSQMDSPVWWLSGLNGDSVAGSPLDRSLTLPSQGTLAVSKQEYGNGEGGGTAVNSVVDLPVTQNVGWWNMDERRGKYVATDCESPREPIGNNDGQIPPNLPLGTANIRSEVLEKGIASPFEDLADPLERAARGDNHLWHEVHQSALGQVIKSHTFLNNSTEPHVEDTLDDESDDTQDDTLDDPNTMIGSFYHNGKFKCLEQRCSRKTFNRQAELRRHYDTTHAPRKPEYWCRVASCQRSHANGGYPFPRRDKLRDHMRKVHGRS